MIVHLLTQQLTMFTYIYSSAIGVSAVACKPAVHAGHTQPKHICMSTDFQQGFFCPDM